MQDIWTYICKIYIYARQMYFWPILHIPVAQNCKTFYVQLPLQSSMQLPLQSSIHIYLFLLLLYDTKTNKQTAKIWTHQMLLVDSSPENLKGGSGLSLFRRYSQPLKQQAQHPTIPLYFTAYLADNSLEQQLRYRYATSLSQYASLKNIIILLSSLPILASFCLPSSLWLYFNLLKG